MQGSYSVKERERKRHITINFWILQSEVYQLQIYFQEQISLFLYQFYTEARPVKARCNVFSSVY